MGTYCESSDVSLFLRTAKDIIRVGTDTSDDLFSTDLDVWVNWTDDEINGKLARSYSLPLILSNSVTAGNLKQVSIKLTSFNIWNNLYPAVDVENVPNGVLNWRKKALDMLDDIVSYNLPLAGEVTTKVNRAPKIATHDPVFDGIGIDQENSQFDNEVLENSSDGDE